MVANDSGGGQLALEEGDEELQIPMSVASDGHGTMKHSAVGEGDGSDPSSEAVEDEEEKSGGEGAQNGGVLVKPAAKKKRNLPGTPGNVFFIPYLFFAAFLLSFFFLSNVSVFQVVCKLYDSIKFGKQESGKAGEWCACYTITVTEARNVW